MYVPLTAEGREVKADASVKRARFFMVVSCVAVAISLAALIMAAIVVARDPSAPAANGNTAVRAATTPATTPNPMAGQSSATNAWAALRDSEYLTERMTKVEQVLSVLQTTGEQELRSQYNSGVINARNFNTGTKSYHQQTNVNGGTHSIHSHPDFVDTCGMGEITATLNGVEFATRHNDYRLRRASTTSKDFHAMEDIPRPTVPKQVEWLFKSKGKDAAVAEMQMYYKAFKEQDITIRDYRGFFNPLLCYLEGAWLTAKDSLADPFASDRHVVDANTFSELVGKQKFLMNSGRKNNLENLSWLPYAVREVNQRRSLRAGHWDATAKKFQYTASGAHTMYQFGKQTVAQNGYYMRRAVSKENALTTAYVVTREGLMLFVYAGKFQGTVAGGVSLQFVCKSSGCRQAKQQWRYGQQAVWNNGGTAQVQLNYPKNGRGFLYGPLRGSFHVAVKVTAVKAGMTAGQRHMEGDLSQGPTRPLAVGEIYSFQGTVKSVPSLAQWDYRILCHKLDTDVPTTQLRVKNELALQMSRGVKPTDEFSANRYARFDLNPTKPMDWVPKLTNFVTMSQAYQPLRYFSYYGETSVVGRARKLYGKKDGRTIIELPKNVGSDARTLHFVHTSNRRTATNPLYWGLVTQEKGTVNAYFTSKWGLHLNLAGLRWDQKPKTQLALRNGFKNMGGGWHKATFKVNLNKKKVPFRITLSGVISGTFPNNKALQVAQLPGKDYGGVRRIFNCPALGVGVLRCDVTGDGKLIVYPGNNFAKIKGVSLQHIIVFHEHRAAVTMVAPHVRYTNTYAEPKVGYAARIVTLDGMLKVSGTDRTKTHLFTIRNKAHRPLKAIRFMARSAKGFKRITITPGGGVYVEKGDFGNWISLSGINYRTGLEPQHGTKFLDGSYGRQWIDELMETVPGKDNYPANLNDLAFGDKVAEFNNASKVMNTGYYSRFYNLDRKDAMGVTRRRRSYNDLTLWSAQTTRQEVSPITAVDERAGKRYSYTQRWSYAVPLEIVYQHPLLSWNPYNLRFNGRGEKLGHITQGGRNGGLTSAKAFNGTSYRHFFQVPASFFEGKGTSTAADTSRGIVGILDPKGTVRQVRASGMWVSTPPVGGGVGSVRLRYPIAPVAEEKQKAYKEVEALKDLLFETGLVNFEMEDALELMKSKTRTREMRTQASKSTKIAAHTHDVSLSPADTLRLNRGEEILKSTGTGAGHSHQLTLKLVNGKVVISDCEGKMPGEGTPCRDLHPKILVDAM